MEHSLSHLLHHAQNAYNGISFDPEKRGTQLIKECEQELNEDLEWVPEGMRAQYAAKYEQHLTKWISAKARCLSPMITGPARFPVARNEKHNRWERSAYDELQTFRERTRKSIEKAAKEPVTVTSELEGAKKQLADRTATQAYMKRINEAHRKYLKDPMGFEFKGFTDKEVELVVSYVPKYSWEPNPFPPYMLTNNNAQIKRYTERVAELEKKEAKRQEAPETEALAGEGWRIVENHEDDRLQIFFDDKPGEELRTELKKHGFKWAPSASAWQRKLTDNARWSTNHYIIPLLKQQAA